MLDFAALPRSPKGEFRSDVIEDVLVVKEQRRVLVAHSCESLAELLGFAVQKFFPGTKVVIESKAERALWCLAGETFDVVLCEAWFSGLENLEIPRLLRAQRPSSVCVAFTCCDLPETRERAMDAGVFRLFVVPKPLKEVMAAVAEALTLAEQQRGEKQ